MGVREKEYGFKKTMLGACLCYEYLIKEID